MARGVRGSVKKIRQEIRRFAIQQAIGSNAHFDRSHNQVCL